MSMLPNPPPPVTPGIECHANGLSSFAAQIADHYDFLDTAAHRPDGVDCSPPLPRLGAVRLGGGARLRRRDRLREELAILADKPREAQYAH